MNFKKGFMLFCLAFFIGTIGVANVGAKEITI